MKVFTTIFLLLVAMSTATFAGTGITATVQGRTLQVEVVDDNCYHVSVDSPTRLIGTRSNMTKRNGVYVVEIPEGSDYIEVIATNKETGKEEVIPIYIE